jgi:hypothetical protein
MGHADGAAICGSTQCDKAGLIWLEPEERKAYTKGVRIFRIPNLATKLRASDYGFNPDPSP